jgi:very-short-patch-repair endonuclease
MIIEKKEWEFCKICNYSLSEMVKQYGGTGVYKSQCFKKHIEECHELSLTDYFGYGPSCPCGVCNKKLTVILDGSNIRYKKIACGLNEGVKKWSQEAKTNRLGSNNPMFGKIPWNNGLNKENSDLMKRISDKAIGRKPSVETKQKQSESAKKRSVHGHTGHKHTEETKQKLRENTLRLIKEGIFKQNDTLPCRKFKDLLEVNNINYEQEKRIEYWSFDFYLIDYNICIEIDGDYWHSNPKIYKDGPKTSTQKRNAIRDIKKNKFCKNNNIKLIRFWESDILGDIECILQKLLDVIK